MQFLSLTMLARPGGYQTRAHLCFWISNESDMHSKGSAGLRTLKFHQDLEVFEHVLIPERLVNGCEWCGAQLQF